jgi:hypothetical protein
VLAPLKKSPAARPPGSLALSHSTLWFATEPRFAVGTIIATPPFPYYRDDVPSRSVCPVCLRRELSALHDLKPMARHDSHPCDCRRERDPALSAIGACVCYLIPKDYLANRTDVGNAVTNATGFPGGTWTRGLGPARSYLPRVSVP